MSINTLNPDEIDKKNRKLNFEVKNGRRSPPQANNALSLDGGEYSGNLKKRRIKRTERLFSPGPKLDEIELYDITNKPEKIQRDYIDIVKKNMKLYKTLFHKYAAATGGNT